MRTAITFILAAVLISSCCRQEAPKEQQKMRRFGQMIRLKPEGAEQYIYHHQNPWPEVNAMIKECNIRNYSIYFRDNYLFAYFEYVGEDFDADMKKMAADPVTQKWWDTVKPLMEPLDNRKEGEFWSDMEEVYHLD